MLYVAAPVTCDKKFSGVFWCLAEADISRQLYCISRFHSSRGSHWTAGVSTHCPRVAGPVLLAVSVGDWSAWLPDGVGQCNADQRDVTSDSSHLIKLQSRRTDYHCCHLVPRDKADIVVDQRADGGLWCTAVRHHTYERGNRRQPETTKQQHDQHQATRGQE